MGCSAAPLEKTFCSVGGRRLAYAEVGTGKPIVLLHGNPASSYLWRNVVPHLAESGKFIVPDLIGHGDSDKLPAEQGPGRYSFAVAYSYLDGLLSSIGVTSDVTLVLHDWGSALGFHWAWGARWSVLFSLVVLAAATAAIALESDLVSAGLDEAAAALRLSPAFLGVILLALVGTAGDLFAAAWFASKDKMGLVLQICIGSAIQIALVVAPVLVILSWLIGQPMTLVFSNPLHLFAIAGTALIVSSVARDGETTWFEGVLLAGVYCLFGLAFFFSG